MCLQKGNGKILFKGRLWMLSIGIAVCSCNVFQDKSMHHEFERQVLMKEF